MENQNKMSVTQCSRVYSVEAAFIRQLNDSGIIELIDFEEETYIAYDHLADLEKYMHLHYELEINFAGLEAIKHLLDRVQQLQLHIKRLEGSVAERSF